MNFRKNSKWPLTPPHFRKIILQLFYEKPALKPCVKAQNLQYNFLSKFCSLLLNFLALSEAVMIETRKRKLRGQKKANIKNCKIVPYHKLLVRLQPWSGLSCLSFYLSSSFLFWIPFGSSPYNPFSLFSISDNPQFVTKFNQWLLDQYSCFKKEIVFWSCGLLHIWCFLHSSKWNKMILRRFTKLILRLLQEGLVKCGH